MQFLCKLVCKENVPGALILGSLLKLGVPLDTEKLLTIAFDDSNILPKQWEPGS